MIKKIQYLLLLLLSVNIFYGQEIKGSFDKDVQERKQIKYLFDYPNATKGKIPLIVFLHGSGERGTNLESVKAHSPFTYKNLMSEPVAILAPQCPENQWWDTDAVYHLIQKITKKYNIDQKRIYLTGLSMGGWGTLKLAMDHPDIFAAVASICAPTDRVMYANIHQYKDLNIKIFHGGMDDVVLPENAFKFYQKLHPINPKAELVIFPNDNHNAWDSTYSNPKFWEWMFSQQLKLN